jgi:hypothetical protein
MSAENAGLRRLMQVSSLKYADLYFKCSSEHVTKRYKAIPSRLRVVRAHSVRAIICTENHHQLTVEGHLMVKARPFDCNAVIHGLPSD